MEGPIFGGAYVLREISVSKSIGLACSGKEIYHVFVVLLCIRGQFPSTSPPGGLYSEGRFNGGFFALQFWGLIFGGAYFRNFTVPLLIAIRYLEEDHIQYCVPSSVSSGLSSLPVSYVYVNGTANISQPTTKVLPFGEPLNGSKAYMELLSFFTTTNSTPDEVYNLGYDMLRKLYPEVTHYYREPRLNITSNIFRTIRRVTMLTEWKLRLFEFVVSLPSLAITASLAYTVDDRVPVF